MWIFCTDGFFSVAQHEDKPNSVMIKARNRDHLERFVAWVEAGWSHELQIEESLDYDYVVRVGCLKTIWAQYLERCTMQIDYTGNVKGNIAKATGDYDLANSMLDSWESLVRYQRTMHPGSARDLG